MRTIYFSLVSFLFLFTLINSDFSSNFRYQSETEPITNKDNLTINESGSQEFNLTNSLSDRENYTINISITIKENNCDLLSFELDVINETESNITDINMTFYLPEKFDHSPIEEHNNMTLKLSQIIPGDYYMIISIFKEEKEEPIETTWIESETWIESDGPIETDVKKREKIDIESLLNKGKELNKEENYMDKNNYQKEIQKIKINLKYNMENYTDKIRLRDNDEIFITNNTWPNLTYEFGLNNSKKVILTVLGYDINDFDFWYKIDNQEYTLTKNFFNGYSLIIDDDFIKNKSEEMKFEYNIVNNRSITVKTRIYNENTTLNSINNSHYDIVLTNRTNKKCFIIDNNDKYLLNCIAYAKNIKFSNDGNPGINEEKTFFYKITDKTFCFERINNKTDATLSFDLLNLTKGFHDFSVIRGLTTRFYLAEQNMAYFRPKLNLEDKEQVVINFHKIGGNLNLFIINGTDNETLQNDINGFVTYKSQSYLAKNIYAEINCYQACEFDIEIKYINEYGYLYPEFLFQTFLNKDSKDYYKLFIPNNTDYSEKEIVIYIFYLKKSPKVEINAINNKILGKNIISYNIPMESLSQKDNILINITTDSGLYYGILYEIKEKNLEDIPIISGLANIFNLSSINEVQKFFTKFKNYPLSNKLILSVNTFSNNILFNLLPSQENNLIQKELNGELSFFNLSTKSVINESNINIYSFEKESNSKILIDEGVQYSNQLNENITSITYSLLREKDELYSKKEYILNFRKYSHELVEIGINLQNANSTYIIYKLSEFIFINSSNIICHTNPNKEFCELIITIRLSGKGSKIDFSFMLISDELIYLPKNTFMSGILRPDKTDIYYGIVDSNEYELYLDFLEGVGKAVMKLEEKEIPFDYYNKKFILNKCSYYCSFTLTINLGKEKPNNSKFKYNLYLKTKKQTLLIPQLETIYGSLEKISNYYIQYYSLMKTRPNETRELNCDFCELNIKEKKDEVWKNEIKEVVYSINLTENVAQSDYYFKIYFHDRDTKLNLYYLNSFRNHHFCEAKVDNHCYYLTYIEKYNNVNKLQFLVQNNENVAIYIKLIDKNYTFEKIYSELNLCLKNNIYHYRK